MKSSGKTHKSQTRQYTFTEFLRKFFPNTDFEREDREMLLRFCSIGYIGWGYWLFVACRAARRYRFDLLPACYHINLLPY